MLYYQFQFFHSFLFDLTAHNWQKGKKNVNSLQFIEQKKLGYLFLIICLKDNDFSDYMKFGVISLKFEILSTSD